MSQLQLDGSLVYPSGLWGGSGPAAGVSVEVIQNHVLSSSQTTIWSGTTDDSGQFSGKSSEWRRTVSVGTGRLSHDEPDLTDVLALTCHITDNSGPVKKEMTVPFVWLGDHLPSPPIFLSWNPPTARKGRINGADCWTFSDLAKRARLGARTPITVELYLYGQDARQSASKLQSIATDMARFAASFRPTAITQPLFRNTTAAADKFAQNTLKTAQTFRQSQFGTKAGSANAATQQAGQPAVETAVVAVDLMAAIVVAVFALSVPVGAVAVVAAAVAVEGVLVTIEVAMAVAGAAITIVVTLPALLLQLAALLDAMGLQSAASSLRDAANYVAHQYSYAWFRVGLDICIIVVLIVDAILAGLATFVAQIVTGPEGQSALRLQTSS